MSVLNIFLPVYLPIASRIRYYVGGFPARADVCVSSLTHQKMVQSDSAAGAVAVAVAAAESTQSTHSTASHEFDQFQVWVEDA